ncbi:nuclear transport factor 2 family protein [Nocardia mexicana]|uniref:SnoaL-like protein n=1 Tax=Nocardia mexicana TaxID=279262 RepID=A0A370GNN4_9NOCA|nr:nuclear transport factor 2 family protein [Nocardia mexicana]RDI45352.1 hypothetical protein DFR68_113123 [Nocardia mexicana]
MDKTNKQLTIDVFRAFASGNIDVLRTLLHENFIEHKPGNPSGRDQSIEYIVTAPVVGARLDLVRVFAVTTWSCITA